MYGLPFGGILFDDERLVHERGVDSNVGGDFVRGADGCIEVEHFVGNLALLEQPHGEGLRRHQRCSDTPP